MLLLLFTLFLQLFVFYSYSLPIRFIYNSRKLLSLEILKGIAVLSTVSLITAFFTSLSLKYEIIILSVAILFFILFKGWKEFPYEKLKSKLFILLVLLTAFVGSMNAFIYDTFLYYLPSIKWLDEYGMVKGLANFDFNFGQMSLWHILQSTFNNTIDPTYKINASLIVLFCIYVWEINKKQFLLFLPLFYFFVASPSTDLVVYVFSAILILNYLINKSQESIFYGLIGSTVLVLIKPLSIILPFYFFYLYIKSLRYKLNYAPICVVFFLFVLFVSKNIFLTGNPIFPLKGGVLKLVHSVPYRMYEINDLLVRHIIIEKADSKALSAFKDYMKWNDYDYFLVLFSTYNVGVILYLIVTAIVILFLVNSIIKRNFADILLSLLIVFKILIIMYTSMQYRFIVDGLILVSCFIGIRFNINLKLIIPLIVIFGISFVYSKQIFKIQDPNFIIRNRPKDYTINRLLVSKNAYTAGYKTEIFNFKTNVNLSHDLSYDLKQPVIPKKIFRMYLYQNSHPELIDSSDIKLGFKMVPNEQNHINEINTHLNNIQSYRKQLEK